MGALFERDETFDPARINRTLWLSGSDFFIELMMPPLLERLRIEAPGVKVYLVDQVFPTSLQALENGKIDFAFWPDVAFPKWVGSEHLITTRFEFVARKGHPRLASAGVRDGDPLPIDLMCDLAHVHFSPDGHQRDDIEDLLKARGRERNITATLPTFHGVARVTLASDLIGTLPTHFTDCLAERDRLTRHPYPIERPPIPLLALWHRRNDQAPFHLWFRRLMQTCFADLEDAV